MYINCACCGNQFTSKDELAPEEAKMFVCVRCDDARLDEMRREIAEMEDDERWMGEDPDWR